jgi:hypothetical protein
VTEAGENWNVSPAGRPEALKVTGALNPLLGATWICSVPVRPAGNVTVGVATVNWKSPATTAAAAVMAPNNPPFSLFTPAEKYRVFGSPVPF